MNLDASGFMYNELTHSTDVTNLVSTSIYNARMIPEDDQNKSTINFYKTSPFEGGSPFYEQRFSIDCRALEEATASQIAFAVFLLFNRTKKKFNGYEYFSRCSILPPIPPRDEADVFNIPVEIYIRGGL